jgi:hypothetical protein
MNELRPSRGKPHDPPRHGSIEPVVAPGPKIVMQFTLCRLRNRHLGG